MGGRRRHKSRSNPIISSIWTVLCLGQTWCSIYNSDNLEATENKKTEYISTCGRLKPTGFYFVDLTVRGGKQKKNVVPWKLFNYKSRLSVIFSYMGTCWRGTALLLITLVTGSSSLLSEAFPQSWRPGKDAPLLGAISLQKGPIHYQ